MKNKEAYGFSNVIQPLELEPIQKNTNPTTSNLGYEIGQIWINSSTGNPFILARISEGNAIWIALGKPEILTEGRVTLTTGTADITIPGAKSTDKIIYSRTSVNSSTSIGELEANVPLNGEVSFTSVNPADPTSTEINDNSIIDYIVYIA